MSGNDAMPPEVPTDPEPAERGGDRGYVMALAALLMVPMLAFTGFAVDLGSWYGQAAKIQNAADAAALAGVTQLPDLNAATATAREVAARNGFVHGQDEVTVTVTDLGNQRLRVEITDGDANQYFTSIFTDDVTISRGAEAEFVLPVAMGSPRNYLGTGQLFEGNYRENLLLAVNGPCAGREQGDWLGSVSGATFLDTGNPPTAGGGWYQCLDGATFVHDAYDPNGYYFGIAVPEDYPGGALHVKVYDAARCASDFDNQGGADAFPTQFRLLDHNATPWDPTNNPPLVTWVFPTGDHCGTATTGGCGPATTSSWRERWCTLGTLADPQPGELYFLQVRTSGFPEGDATISTTAQHRLNAFSIAASPSGGEFTVAQACTADPFDNIPHDPGCPQVYAFNYLPVFASFAEDPSFFLAEIGPEHSNKELVIDLFDIGEGTQALEILDPTGDAVTFDWTVVNESGADVAPTDGWSGTTDNLDVLGTPGTGAYCRGFNPQAGPRRFSPSKYNDRVIRLSIDLPPDIQAAYGGGTWWRIRYTMCTATGASQSDRTTWNAQILGDPVRLIR